MVSADDIIRRAVRQLLASAGRKGNGISVEALEINPKLFKIVRQFHRFNLQQNDS